MKFLPGTRLLSACLVFCLSHICTICSSWIHPRTTPSGFGTPTTTSVSDPSSSSSLVMAAAAATGTSFDFSAPSEWETFYQESPGEVLEWHSSIPLERIASYIVPPADNGGQRRPKVLLVGCGNSRLPATLLSSCNTPRIVLLDTSQTCLDQLEQLYGLSVEYRCGNAVQLDSLFPNKDDRNFDIVVDKGLSDALFCSEGWNGPVQDLYESASKVLRPNGGRYLLVSYKLPSSTKEFLREIGDTVSLEWQFDLPEDSNERVGVSLAVKN